MFEERTKDFESIQLRLASPEDILGWSHGEVTRPETINYRTARPERDGLFDERIFGPVKDWECYCGKYRRIRYKGIVCDKCGVEVTRAIVRRERFGHIQLASPVAHIWFLRGVPSKIGALLDMSVSDLEKVIYFASYIITKVDVESRDQTLASLEKEYKTKVKKAADKTEEREIKEARDKAREELKSLQPLHVISEIEYFKLSRKYGEVFEAAIGSEPIRDILKTINLAELQKKLEKDFLNANPVLKKKILKRLKIVKSMVRSGVKPEWMFLTVIPVIPPDLRPMVPLDGGRYASSDLNDLYRRVINRNNRLKKLFELNAPEVITRNEKRMLQEAVDALIDNSIRRGSAPVASQVQRRPLRSFADILKGKQGRFRQNLLGKRVDYSGRSVIVVGPDLKLHQCGLPKEMALELFKPFVIRKLIEQEIAHNIRGAGRIIEDRHPVIWAILEEVIQNKMVLLNRAPTLHRLGIQAFQPILIEGHAIQIHPLVCTAFNADFDGDQMAVHLPLTDEAQNEAHELMVASKNLLKPANGTPIVNPTKDMVLGCYWVTTYDLDDTRGTGKTFASEEEALLAADFGEIGIRTKIKVRLTKHFMRTRETEGKKKAGAKPACIETSVGRILFNQLLPDGFDFLNEEMKSKSLEALISRLIKRYGSESIPEILDKIKKFGFEYATRSGISWGINDLRTPETKQEIIKKAHEEVSVITKQYQRGLLTDWERYSRIVEVWLGAKEAVLGELKKTMPKDGSVFAMIDSGARGGWVQTNQMAGMKGPVVNPSGRIIELPIISSYKEGLNVLEYFISTHGARKGTADTALKTAAAGYLTRRLVDVAQEVVIAHEDCGTKKGIVINRTDSEEIGKTLASRIVSRYAADDIKDPSGKVLAKKGALLDDELARKIDEAGADQAVVRSVITCAGLRGICRFCYGLDLSSNHPIQLGEAAGIIAAQAIGEPGTQLTMRTFHIGGVAGSGDITSGLPRVEELFEARHPKGEALLADVDGEVLEILELNKEKIIRVRVQNALREEKKIAVKRGTRKKDAAQASEGEIREFTVPRGVGLMVEKGSAITRGMLLTEGHADLNTLYKLAGSAEVQRYIIKEVQKIYSRQGASIHDKHIEVIISQMFARVKVKDVGDTSFTIGEVVSKARFREENARIAREGKRKATAYQLLFGITKSALNTDSLFAAASFIETARVLINAAIDGKKDYLRGLKENVIIGHLIPAGTGFRKRLREAKERAAEVAKNKVLA